MLRNTSRQPLKSVNSLFNLMCSQVDVLKQKTKVVFKSKFFYRLWIFKFAKSIHYASSFTNARNLQL